MDMIQCMIGIKIKVNTTSNIQNMDIWHFTFCQFSNIMKHFIGHHKKLRHNLLFLFVLILFRHARVQLKLNYFKKQ